MSRRPLLVAPLLLGLLVAPVLIPRFAQAAPEELGPTTRVVDQQHLEVDLRLDLETGEIAGTARHRMTVVRDDVSEVRLHLEDMSVSAVSTGDGAVCTSSHAGDVLTITLDRPRKKGDTLKLEITYAGTPTAGLWFFRPTEAYPEIPLQVWSQGQGTENRHWIPMYDLPDDRLTTRLALDVPSGLTTLSNGKLESKEASGDGRERHVWSLDRPQPPYLISLVVGTFEDVVRDAAGVEQHDLVPPGWEGLVDECFGRTPSMMAFLAEVTGEPYPWGRYSQITVWDFMWGGMENTGATTLNMRALHGEGVRPDYAADGLVCHELAHDWFGDLITCRTWNQIWLNEGFATYFTDLWVEQHHGPEDFAVGRLRSRQSYLDAIDLPKTAATPRPASPTDCGDMQRKPYVKGSSVLHLLRNVMGDDAFRRGIRRYVAGAKDRSVESEELRAALEAETDVDLGGLFDQLVYGSGYPRLAVSGSYQTGPNENGAFVMDVVQTQPATEHMPHFTLPVDVEVTWSDGTVERRRHTLSEAQHSWRIQGPGKPLRWRIDPDTWLVARIEATKSRVEWEAQLADDPRATGRLLAARALGGQGIGAAPALGRSAAGDAHHSVRAEAATALGEIGGREAATALIATAEDADSRVRRAALTAMAGLPADWVAATLIRHAHEDVSVYAAAEACTALGKTRAPRALAALTTALGRESHRDVIRREVMNGLAALGDPRGAELARHYLGYAWGKGLQHRLRHAALDAMVALDPHSEVTRVAVIGLIRDPYFRMRIWASAHAADLGLTGAIPELEEGLKTSWTGPGVKGAYNRALKSLRVD